MIFTDDTARGAPQSWENLINTFPIFKDEHVEPPFVVLMPDA
jgi:hypothetical protein